MQGNGWNQNIEAKVGYWLWWGGGGGQWLVRKSEWGAFSCPGISGFIDRMVMAAWANMRISGGRGFEHSKCRFL